MSTKGTIYSEGFRTRCFWGVVLIRQDHLTVDYWGFPFQTSVNDTTRLVLHT